MIQLLGKFPETGEKGGSVFGKTLINLEKIGSVFGKLLRNLDTVGSVVGKFPGPRFIQSSGLGFV